MLLRGLSEMGTGSQGRDQGSTRVAGQLLKKRARPVAQSVLAPHERW